LNDNATAENVQKLYRDKKIDIVGGMYDLATGKVALV